MEIHQVISVIDCHTEGEFARVVVGGIRHIPGSTMAAKRVYAIEHLEGLRDFLTHEPRAPASLAALILTEPTHPDAHVGVLIMEPDTMVPMCGHGSIAVVKVVIETGMVSAQEPFTLVNLDTPAGLVRARARVENGDVTDVTVQNVPSFAQYLDLKLDVPDLGQVTVDLTYGGDYYIIVSAESVGVEIVPEEIDHIIAIAARIRAAFWREIRIRHPEDPAINEVKYMVFSAPPTRPGATLKNVVVDTPGQIDHSPCGTGTCAKMAQLYARGELGLHQEFVHEGILGTVFRGKLIDESRVGDFKAVVPEFSGRAYIVSMGQLVLDARDPFPTGISMIV